MSKGIDNLALELLTGELPESSRTSDYILGRAFLIAHDRSLPRAVELSGFLGTKIHGLSTDVQCETLSQHRSITMTQFLT
ncbi:hypothetical protein N657DRAFT_643216 [Parathielavia appendiculata]|uniref:Uncharacterized protein n=1 Tax=Parathielavia appendiculata TaxID=2587402 RepID=A0AAN6U5X3_9PEZI|nr:hypothetical protein N657DRAFT_643216 [Parathielavia appendiculata]